MNACFDVSFKESNDLSVLSFLQLEGVLSEQIVH